MSGERVDVEWFQKDFYRTAKEKFNDVSLIKLLWCKMWIINMKLLPLKQREFMCKMFNYYSKGVEDYKLSETFFYWQEGNNFQCN